MTVALPERPTPTAEQAAAAHAGPLGAWLIAAGPGTGKTFTMVERFCWLVEAQGLPATSILAVTFTDAAAAELRERVAAELTARGRRSEAATLDAAWIGTFHGVCARLLRDHAYLVGLPRELRVLDELDQKLLAQRLAARLRSGQAGDLDPDSFSALRPDEVADLVRDGVNFALKLKGRGIGPTAFWERALAAHAASWQDAELPAARAEAEAIRVLHAVYAAYQAWLAEEHRLDFDDLVLAVIDALEGVPEFRALCRQTFRSIVVDEFQDTNRIQLELIRLLAADGFGNVAVVGDAKQSIYGWRDAEVENIRSRFPGTRLPLTRNRRSVQPVLDLATAFIRVDRQFADEPGLVAERGAGGGRPVTVAMAPDAGSEARLVAAEIRRLNAAGTPYSAIAILAHSVKRLPREFEEELRRQGVPYLTSAGAGFFDREEVKDVLALLRLVAASPAPARTRRTRESGACACATASTRPGRRASRSWRPRWPSARSRCWPRPTGWPGAGTRSPSPTFSTSCWRAPATCATRSSGPRARDRAGCSTCARCSAWPTASSATARWPGWPTSWATWTGSWRPTCRSPKRRWRRRTRSG
jgi:DNA helicase-2/ATP-dependent DNA helicase PcrA